MVCPLFSKRPHGLSTFLENAPWSVQFFRKGPMVCPLFLKMPHGLSTLQKNARRRRVSMACDWSERVDRPWGLIGPMVCPLLAPDRCSKFYYGLSHSSSSLYISCILAMEYRHKNRNLKQQNFLRNFS